MKKNDFQDLFISELKLIYNAEEQIVKALPEMVDAASNEKLIEALTTHLKETKEQVKRLEEIATQLQTTLTGEQNEAMAALIRDAQKNLKKSYNSHALDAAIISGAQIIEHYEIALYGSLKAFAKHLEFDKIEDLLKKTQKEESHADKILTEIAEGGFFQKGINEKAVGEK